MEVVILIAIVVFVIDVALAREFSAVAEAKGWYGSKYFWYGVFFGIVGYLLVIALPDQSQ